MLAMFRHTFLIPLRQISLIIRKWRCECVNVKIPSFPTTAKLQHYDLTKEASSPNTHLVDANVKYWPKW